MHYTGPKARKVRKQGMNIYGAAKYDKILQKKPYGPGKDPKTRRGKLSEYGQQLMEKQKARDMFGITEKQLQRIYKEASRGTDQTDRVMKQMLERRLDNTVFRAGFAVTRMQARQMVSHGMFTVNGRRVTIASFQVKSGDTIEVRTKAKSSPMFETILAAHERYNPPAWVKADPKAMSISVAAIPAEEHLEKAVDMRKVVEFYSR